MSSLLIAVILVFIALLFAIPSYVLSLVIKNKYLNLGTIFFSESGEYKYKREIYSLLILIILLITVELVLNNANCKTYYITSLFVLLAVTITTVFIISNTILKELKIIFKFYKEDLKMTEITKNIEFNSRELKNRLKEFRNLLCNREGEKSGTYKKWRLSKDDVLIFRKMGLDLVTFLKDFTYVNLIRIAENLVEWFDEDVLNSDERITSYIEFFKYCKNFLKDWVDAYENLSELINREKPEYLKSQKADLKWCLIGFVKHMKEKLNNINSLEGPRVKIYTSDSQEKTKIILQGEQKKHFDEIDNWLKELNNTLKVYFNIDINSQIKIN